MSYPHHPGYEFSVVLVTTSPNRLNNLQECILKNIVGEIAVSDVKTDIGIDLTFVTQDEHLDASFITAHEACYKLIIGQFALHNSINFGFG